ncbi:hypothetical protein BDV93DRAFT_608729 [Ceratobasidium sp. AG-I]|nr:hypothetical protein BDV93DRAFT_608729 [Ceratobasidium sp. AG-I]
MASARPARINTLPLEILSFIFATVVNASLYARSIGDDSYGFIEYPTLLSSVCAHWRRVSLSITYLWSYIDLMLGNERLRNTEHINLWLERSQNSPLRLRLGAGGEHVEGSPKYFKSLEELDERLAPILSSSAQRVHSFTLRFDDPDFGANVLACLLPVEGQLPIRELALRQRFGSVERAQLLPQDKWTRLLEPLRVLHLESSGLSLSGIPCRNLVELRLIYYREFPPLASFTNVLELNPGLCTLVLDSIPLSGTQPFPITQPISLPSLRHVQLSTNEDFIVWFLKTLVPGSHELEIHFGYIGKPTLGSISIGDAMVSFFRRTRVKLLSLQPEGIALLPVLSSLPHLQSLMLIAFEFDANTLAGIELTTNLLPKLHNIDLDECNLNDYSELPSGLHTLLSLPSVRRIRYLNCGDPRTEGVQDRFAELLEEGGFAATITPASALDYADLPSPFR